MSELQDLEYSRLCAFLASTDISYIGSSITLTESMLANLAGTFTSEGSSIHPQFTFGVGTKVDLYLVDNFNSTKIFLPHTVTLIHFSPHYGSYLSINWIGLAKTGVRVYDKGASEISYGYYFKRNNLIECSLEFFTY